MLLYTKPPDFVHFSLLQIQGIQDNIFCTFKFIAIQLTHSKKKKKHKSCCINSETDDQVPELYFQRRRFRRREFMGDNDKLKNR